MVSGVMAATKYRDFTSADGKTIRGCIQAYDAKTKTVIIERDNRRTNKVQITVFSEADQAYILEWNTVDEFMSSKCLSVSVNKNRDSLPKEETSKGKKSKKGATSKSGGFSVHYEIEFYLMNAAPMKDVRMEYKIYYEQSDAHFGFQEPEQKIFNGQISIPLIEPGKKCVIVTEKVKIQKDSVPPKKPKKDEGAGQGHGAKGDVHGVRARLYLKLPSGKEVKREFSYPDKLPSGKFGWKG